jgi:hypothetical protein
LIFYDNNTSKYKYLLYIFYHFFKLEKYVVSDEAKIFLRSLKSKIGVIAVAGKYRTGKSFLLNRVILN